MKTILILALAANAVLHVLSARTLRRQGAPTLQVAAVAAYVVIDAALATGVALGARWALPGALALPLLGGLGLAIMTLRARRISAVDAGILACDLACVALSSLLLFG